MSNLQKYNVVLREYISPEKWDDFVHQCDECWLWHTSDFLDIFQSWARQEDKSFAVTNNNEDIVAIVPLNIHSYRRKKIIPHTHLSIFGGVAVANIFSDKTKRKIKDFIYQWIDDQNFGRNKESIDTSIPPLTPFLWQSDNRSFVNPLLWDGFENHLTQTCVLDLSKNYDEIEKSYSQTTRQMSKRMDEVTISHATSNDLDLYYEMHCETYERTGAKAHPYEYFEGIFIRMLNKGYVHILKLEYQGEIIAMKNCARYKKGAYYWTGASRNNIDSAHNRLLMIEQIKQAKQDGYERFEVGEIFPSEKDNKKSGLTLYKTSFGGDYYPFYKGRKSLK